MAVPGQWVGLAEAIEGVRAELRKAAASGGSPRLVVDAVEMEFAIEVQREAGADGSLKVWVVNASSRFAARRTRRHHVRVTLRPVTDDGEGDWAVASAEDRISPRFDRP